MSVQDGGVRSGSPRASADAGRVLRDRCLLVLNVTILIVFVWIVWSKLAGPDVPDDEPKRPPPLQEQTAAGISDEDRPAPALDAERAAARAATATPRVESSEQLPRVSPPPVAEPVVGDSRPRPATEAPVTRRPEPESSLPPPRPPRPSAPPPEREPWAPAVQPTAPLNAATRARIAETQKRIGDVGVQLEVLRNKAGAYVMSNREFGAHRGIEALYVALVTADRGDGVDVGDADGDGRLEILDAWGRPLVYFSNDDYGTEQAWSSGAARSTSLTAARSRTRGAYHARGRFQLWSAGPNGRTEGGSGDDITSWILRD